MTIEAKPSFVRSRDSTTMGDVLKNSQMQPSDANIEHNYKRRRASYRGKVGTKTGREAYRDMIRKHMVGLSLEMNQELVLGGGFRDDDERDKGVSTAQQSRPDAVNWFNFTDALEVRNRSRPQWQDQFPNRKRQFRRERSNSCGKYGAEDNAYRKGLARVPDRSRRMSRCRSRGPRHWDYHDAKDRHSNRRKEHDWNDSSRDRRREYDH